MVNFKYKQNKHKIPPLMWERLKIRVTPIANYWLLFPKFSSFSLWFPTFPIYSLYSHHFHLGSPYSHPDSLHSYHSPHSVPRFSIPAFTKSTFPAFPIFPPLFLAFRHWLPTLPPWFLVFPPWLSAFPSFPSFHSPFPIPAFTDSR